MVKIALGLIIILVTCLTYFCFSYLLLFPFDMKREELGQFGDSWGILTSIFSAFACLGVYAAWLEQREATKLAQSDSKKQTAYIYSQQFESTFFQMLNFLQSIISDMDLRDNDNNVIRNGRDVFSSICKKLQLECRVQGHNQRLNDFEGFSLATKDKYLKFYSSVYEKIYGDFNNDLGHYFRFLFSIFKYIDSSLLAERDKFKYAKILRAQLSNSELLILFYNSLSDDGRKFMTLADKFELFDNLPLSNLLSMQNAYFGTKKSWGSQSSKLKHDWFLTLR